jgi:hypothetical protein
MKLAMKHMRPVLDHRVQENQVVRAALAVPSMAQQAA